MSKYIKKIKSKFLFIMFVLAFAMTGLTSLANKSIDTQIRNIWFYNVPGYNGQKDGDIAILPNGADGNGWYAVNGNVYQGRRDSKFDHYYYYVNYGNSDNGNIIGQLSNPLGKDTIYNIKLWYKNTGSYDIDIYLLKKLPTTERKKFSEKDLKQDAKKIGEITKTSQEWSFLNLNFDTKAVALPKNPDKNEGETIKPENDFATEKAYIMFVPREKEIGSNISGQFAIDQGYQNVIKKTLEVYDNGLRYPGTEYKGTYGIHDKKIIKDETAVVKVKFENISEGTWKATEKVIVNYKDFGDKTSDGYNIYWYYKGMENDRNDLIPGKEKIEVKFNEKEGTATIISNGELRNDKVYEISFNVKYNSVYAATKYHPFITGTYTEANEQNGELEDKDFSLFKFVEEVDLSEKNVDGNIPKQGVKSIGEHNILDLAEKSDQTSIVHEYIKLGDNIDNEENHKDNGAELDNGWIIESNAVSTQQKGFFAKYFTKIFNSNRKVTLKPNERELFLGTNTIKVKASHVGYVGGFAELGTGRGENIKYTWERVFIKKVNAGENEIEFEIPNGTDTIRGFILKYSLKQTEAGLFDANASSGEVENYIIRPKKVFSGKIEEIKDDGIILNNDGITFGKDDNIFQYNEEVKVILTLTNEQGADIIGKEINFISNMLELKTTDFKIFIGEEETGKNNISRISKKPGVSGIYEIYVSSLPKGTTARIVINGTSNLENFKEFNNNDWKLKAELWEGANQLGNTYEKNIASRDYGNNLQGGYDIHTEVRNYVLANGKPKEGGKWPVGTLYLGEKFEASNNIKGENDPTSDGVILPKYEGTQEKYKGKNVLISGEINKTYVGMEDSGEIPTSWLSYFVNYEWKME